jgi:cysteine desulfurase
MIYFDHNATTPLIPAARDAWVEASEKFIGNPSSPHRLGSRADAALTGAREQLAALLGCESPDIVWTSGATESNNAVLHHVAAGAAAEVSRGVWVSAIEHPCVLDAARHFSPKNHRLIPTLRSGVVDLDWLRDELRATRPALVAVMAANNETGVLQPWREALAVCREHGVPFFCDAAQWVGKLPARGLGECDFVSGCAHKFGGPKGVGFLKCVRGRFRPLLRGGKQEEGRRAGTENVAGVLSMMAALAKRTDDGGLRADGAGAGIDEVRTRIEWRERFEKMLREKVRGAQIVGAGAGAERLWNTVSAVMPETDSRQRWVVKLDKLGFAVSTGSACASGREEPSHVLAAMGYAPAEAGRVLRFSSGWETRPEDWDALANAAAEVYASVRPA